MKLAAKITLLLLLGTLPLIVIAESISLQRENEQMLQEMRADATQLARTISNMVDQLWILGDELRARQAIEQINQLHDADACTSRVSGGGSSQSRCPAESAR